MIGNLRALRRRILTPSMSEAKFSVRGFPEKTPASRELLETTAEMFLTGYAHAAECRSVTEAEARLEQIPSRFRGFAYEGAAMAFAVRDGLPLGHTHHVTDLLASRGERHIYMAYVGIGWAFARLPRMRWGAVAAGASDPLLRWLLLDGYGFHQAFFHTEKYVRQQFREPAFPWPAPGRSAQADRVIDQGIGRAMWFVTGADPDLLAATIEKFPESRHSDLYAGAALAVTYAGGLNDTELQLFYKHAGPHRAVVAQGSAFAAEARLHAGLVTPHTELATQVLCDMTVEDASAVTYRARPNPVVDGEVPAFQLWRERIAAEFAEHGRN
ncbi:DUF1702 family protein [Nocardia terpenica]|uniref:DUF1702 family protein n=1 Tax=Nocardia terpenica TaxID=455432 RepID=UPI001E4A24EB|nr:DUF1702 family protein [Nocardia terpenica]